MTEQNPGQNPANPVDPESPPVTSAGSKQTKVVPGSHPAGLECPDSKQDKAKWTDKTMAFFTVLLFVAAIIQAVIFYRQWEEMHSGGDDTHALALAAKSQADEAREQVGKMQEANDKTSQLVFEATAQANETKQLAGSALKQANATRDLVTQTVAEGRPWIGVGIDVREFQLGHQSKVIITKANTGKRPAKFWTKYDSDLYQGPNDTPRYDLGKVGVTVLVPGAANITEHLLSANSQKSRSSLTWNGLRRATLDLTYS